jgi:prephenate dehydrogenase
MEDGFRLEDARITIVGLGLMGGSLAMALKGKCAALYGIDSDPATLELALRREIVDQADTDLINGLPQADLVILAIPVPAIIDFIRKLPSLISNPCIVLDLGSTKKDILDAMSALPARFDVIGGHPICGKEKLGLENAEADLYEGSAFILTPLVRSTHRARTAGEQIVSALGAHPIEMAADQHDRALAFTSHLPFLVASALTRSTPTEYAPLLGSGFRSTSRLAGTPASMMLGVLQSNRDHILEAIHGFQQQLTEIQTKLESGDAQTLTALLDQSRAAYQALVSNL